MWPTLFYSVLSPSLTFYPLCFILLRSTRCVSFSYVLWRYVPLSPIQSHHPVHFRSLRPGSKIRHRLLPPLPLPNETKKLLKRLEIHYSNLKIDIQGAVIQSWWVTFTSIERATRGLCSLGFSLPLTSQLPWMASEVHRCNGNARGGTSFPRETLEVQRDSPSRGHQEANLLIPP